MLVVWSWIPVIIPWQNQPILSSYPFLIKTILTERAMRLEYMGSRLRWTVIQWRMCGEGDHSLSRCGVHKSEISNKFFVILGNNRIPTSTEKSFLVGYQTNATIYNRGSKEDGFNFIFNCIYFHNTVDILYETYI